MSGVDGILISILPSIGLGLIFWFVMRAVIRADRRERTELAKIDAAEERAAKAAASQENIEANKPTEK